MIEVGELEQASIELKNALQSACIRAENNPRGGATPENISQLLIAVDYIIESLDAIASGQSEDSLQTLRIMLEERRNAPGWETWSTLLRERLSLLEEQELRLQPVRS